MGQISRRAFHETLASALACSALPRIWAAAPGRPTSVALLLSGVITDGDEVVVDLDSASDGLTVKAATRAG